MICHADVNREVAGLWATESPEELPSRKDTEESKETPENGDALLVHARQGDVLAVVVVGPTRAKDDDP